VFPNAVHPAQRPQPTMTGPAPVPPCRAARDGSDELSPPTGVSWFQTRDGRRYGWEIAAILVVKLALLLVLWFAFIKPFPRPATPPAVVVQQLYTSPAPAPRHD
jgi:hypothetical protein